MNDFTCVVFISGTGSNLRAILEAIEKGALAGVKVAAVIADVDALLLPLLGPGPGDDEPDDSGLPEPETLRTATFRRQGCRLRCS